MTIQHRTPAFAWALLFLGALGAGSAGAQDRKGDDTGTAKLNAVEVTGSRIKRSEGAGDSPVLTISGADLQATGLASVGDILQRLSVSGSSLNTKFNSAGNFGFPADGGGVAALQDPAQGRLRRWLEALRAGIVARVQTLELGLRQACGPLGERGIAAVAGEYGGEADAQHRGLGMAFTARTAPIG